MEEQQVILCMYSGGLDSVGNLYRLLKDVEFKNFNVHVHHLSLQNIERRAQAELTAVKKTLNYFSTKEQFRSFQFTHSTHDYSFMKKYFIYDTYWYAFMAANIMTADVKIKHVAVGRTKSDIESADSMMNANRGHEIFHATLPLSLRFQRSYIYPVAHLSKKEIWDMLPHDLREMSWSCRTPIYKNNIATPCGKCRTCLSMKEFRSV